MRNILILICVSCLNPAINGQNVVTVEAIESIRTEMKMMAKKNNFSNMGSLYTVDAVVNGYDALLYGKKEITSYWSNLRGEGVNWEWKNIEYSGNDRWVTQTGTSLLTLKYDSGNITLLTNFSVVWEKQEDDSFKIVSDFYRPIIK